MRVGRRRVAVLVIGEWDALGSQPAGQLAGGMRPIPSATMNTCPRRCQVCSSVAGMTALAS